MTFYFAVHLSPPLRCLHFCVSTFNHFWPTQICQRVMWGVTKTLWPMWRNVPRRLKNELSRKVLTREHGVSCDAAYSAVQPGPIGLNVSPKAFILVVTSSASLCCLNYFYPIFCETNRSQIVLLYLKVYSYVLTLGMSYGTAWKAFRTARD
jgi:hypothetical protein